MKQGRTSIFAAEGTAAHTLSEWAREQHKPCSAFIGQEISVEGYTFKVDEEMAAYVQVFVDWCEKEPGDQMVEIQVRYGEYLKGGYGRLDDARGRNGIIPITDLKYGKGKAVYVESNVQLRMYALGFYLTYGHLYDIEGFSLRISQPRLNYAGEEIITVEQLLEWAERVVKPVQAKLEAGVLEFNAGTWCHYCPIKMGCETRQQWILSQTPTMEQADPLTEFEDLDAMAAAVVNDPPQFSVDIPEDRLSLLLQAAGPVIKFFNEVRAYAQAKFKSGQVNELADTWKMVEGKNYRFYTDKDEAIAKSLRKLGLSEEEIWEPKKLKSPAQVEMKLGKTHVFMKTRVDSQAGKPALVPRSHKKPALSLEDLTGFQDLGEIEEE